MTGQETQRDALVAAGNEIVEAFRPALERITEAFTALGQTFAAVGASVAAFGDSIRAATEFEERVRMMVVWQHPHLARRYAVEHLGITAADIRRAGDDHVRLWNHRRIPLGDGYRPWAYDRVATALQRALSTSTVPLRRIGMLVPDDPTD